MGGRQAFLQRHVPAEGLQSTMLQHASCIKGTHALNMHSTSRVPCRHVTTSCVFQAARIGMQNILSRQHAIPCSMLSMHHGRQRSRSAACRQAHAERFVGIQVSDRRFHVINAQVVNASDELRGSVLEQIHARHFAPSRTCKACRTIIS